MEVHVIYMPERRELELCRECMRITMGKEYEGGKPISRKYLRLLLRARHSPIRVLNFAFYLKDVPSNIATHFCRHVHAVPYVSSLRNDRQEKTDGDLAPRNTPVNMILYCNAEELMTIANKRLCGKAAARTREAARMICAEAIRVMPELHGLLVPMCEYHGGLCYEITPCTVRSAERISNQQCAIICEKEVDI